MIKLTKNCNESISKLDIVNHENKYGKIQNHSSIFFFTGWQKNLKKHNYFTENPGLSNLAAKYLVSKKINLVGIDSPSIDLGNNESFSVHHILAKRDILIVENLANLNRISTTTFDFVVLPLKLKGATGSPVRAVAF